MKKPLFDSVERIYINNHYSNKTTHPKNILIENYMQAKAISGLKKAIKRHLVYKKIIKILDFIAKKMISINNKLT